LKKKIDSSLAILREAWASYGDGLVYPCSFGGESSVLLDLIHQAKLPIQVLTLDTGRLPQATYDFIDEVRRYYHMDVQIVFPDCQEVETMLLQYGPNLFLESPALRKHCCEIRKVHPLQRVLRDKRAWITGRRREQSKGREHIQIKESDHVYGLVKYNPILDWRWEEVRRYIDEHDIPYNHLLDRHYVSIGCECCTRAITIGEDPRAGRWWWENEDTVAECGLHVTSIRRRSGENEQGEGI